MALNTLKLEPEAMMPAAVVNQDSASARVVHLTGKQNIVADILSTMEPRFSLVKAESRRLQVVQ